MTDTPSLLNIAAVFLRLGGTAFGGPLAHIAFMQAELVRRRRWLSDEELLDLVGAANLIPGPNSTEVAIHIGYKLCGWPGLVVAGLCFILPAFLLVMPLAALYVQYGKVPLAAAVLYGLKPVILAIVFQALYGLAKTALKTTALKLTALLAVLLYVAGVNELTLLFGIGLVSALRHFCTDKAAREKTAFAVLSAVSVALIGGTYLLSSYTPRDMPYGPGALFLYFLKLGSVLYGSGYVLLAFLRSDLVEHYHWITSAQLLDAVAIGQITPGPLFTSATFIGFILGGPTGALIATIGIFLPAFLLVAVTAPVIKKMRASALAAHFLDSVNATALALMAVVLFQLAHDALIDAVTIAMAVISAFVLVRFKVNSLWLMLAGAVVGLALHGLKPI
ncbi:MAG: chromate efflux transporter [Cyanobacteria bacterium SZAS LIN-3]|nr:chromate efflux transporter [Cyanobacteria bacterium SZAS LIN-3]